MLSSAVFCVSYIQALVISSGQFNCGRKRTEQHSFNILEKLCGNEEVKMNELFRSPESRFVLN